MRTSVEPFKTRWPRASITSLNARGMQAERRGRDDAEDAFAADEERRRVRAVDAPVHADDLAGAEHALHRCDHVLDLPVEARALAGAARGDPAADRRAQDRRREVA